MNEIGREDILENIVQLPYQMENFLKLKDAVMITDQKGMILEVNHTYEAITGYSSDILKGLDEGFLSSSLTPQSTYTSLKDSIKENKPWSGIVMNQKKSGEIWQASVTITPYKIQDDLFFIGIFRDLEQLGQGIYLSEDSKVKMQKELLRVLAISCEIRDPGIEEHLLSVQDLTEDLVHAHNHRMNLNLDSSYIFNLSHSSILHDIGKAGIPEGILYKPAKLTSYERTIVEMHPLIGVDILKKIYSGIIDDAMTCLKEAKDIILYHHEKWDGTGYPYKLKGEQIPFEARIVSIVDVFDALTRRRPYKEPWTKQEALAYINEEKGKHFDPSIVETFIKLF